MGWLIASIPSACGLAGILWPKPSNARRDGFSAYGPEAARQSWYWRIPCAQRLSPILNRYDVAARAGHDVSLRNHPVMLGADALDLLPFVGKPLCYPGGPAAFLAHPAQDRKRVVVGKSVSARLI